MQELVLQLGDESPELNHENLRRACDLIFDRGVDYGSIVRLNYEGFDLQSWGAEYLPRDILNLYCSCQEADRHHELRGRVAGKRALIVGCGPGRLAPMYLHALTRMGYTHILFNDLLANHVRAAEQVVNSYFARIPEEDRVSTEFHAGDVTSANLPEGHFDTIFAMWHVTAEVMDLASSDALVRKRLRLFRGIHRALSPEGVFIEEVPNVTRPRSFYNLARLKSSHFVSRSRVAQLLGRHSRDLVISHFGHLGQTPPYHIRFMPPLPALAAERELAGFKSFEVVRQDAINAKKYDDLDLDAVLSLIASSFESSAPLVFVDHEIGARSKPSGLPSHLLKWHTTVMWTKQG